MAGDVSRSSEKTPSYKERRYDKKRVQYPVFYIWCNKIDLLRCLISVRESEKIAPQERSFCIERKARESNSLAFLRFLRPNA